MKTKLMTLISEANIGLSPQTIHVLGNWKLNIDKIMYDNKFPLVTVRVTNATEEYQYSGKTPTKTVAQYYKYFFTAFVYALTLSQARGIADDIIDYLAENNKHSDVGIIDIMDLTVQETSGKKGTRRYSKVIASGVIMTEETLI